MTDGVDGGVKTVQTSGPKPPTNRFPAQPEAQQLRPSHNPVLSLRDRGYLQVDSVSSL